MITFTLEVNPMLAIKPSTKKYYFNSIGIMQGGWKKVGGKRYYLNSNGVRIKRTAG